MISTRRSNLLDSIRVRSKGLPMLLLLFVLILGSVESFTILRTTKHLINCQQQSTFFRHQFPQPLHAAAAEEQDEDEEKHPMIASSRLSHVMLKVPSVDATAEYWTDKGGKIQTSTEKPDSANGQAELRSAFVELGCSSSSGRKEDKDEEAEDPACFALELVTTNKEKYSIGNVISYVGVSMLLQFQNDLLGVIKGEEKISTQGDEPNGIPVNSAASAPGDFFARLAFKSNDLLATAIFYTSVLGMDAKAQDEKMVCLRYDNWGEGGIPTTLVFDATEEELVMGDCFDHLAIATRVDINELYGQMEGQKVFMKPTEMFGKQVMGVIDPNGYKVVICSV